MITGYVRSVRMVRSSSKPSTSGSMMSSTARSNSCSRIKRAASAPVYANVTS